MLIEHLTKHSKKEKNYRGCPKNFTSHGYKILGKLNGEIASLTYSFPLKKSTLMETCLNRGLN